MENRQDNDRNVRIFKKRGAAADPLVPPVLFMTFNRAETTRKVFEKVCEARPAKIFVAGNGPRPDTPRDKDKCSEVWAIFDGVDWDCEVATNFRVTNINMHRHWYAALDWFFENVDSGIILEDDCVPNPSFFQYCAELLSKYRDDERIMHVNGSNFQFGAKRGDASYYFSKYAHVWGWATWKRAWQKYDVSLSSFPAFKRDDIIKTIVSDDLERKYWMKFFDGVYSGTYKTSDAKWQYAIWNNQGICITPNVNMISNIGYGVAASHTVIKDKTMCQEAHDIGKIIQVDAGTAITPDLVADQYTFRVCFHRTFIQKALYKVVHYITS